jgi:hypothetical protein
MILLVNGRAPLVMPEQTLRGEAIGSIVLGASVVGLHLMGAEERSSIILVPLGVV